MILFASGSFKRLCAPTSLLLGYHIDGVQKIGSVRMINKIVKIVDVILSLPWVDPGDPARGNITFKDLRQALQPLRS